GDQSVHASSGRRGRRQTASGQLWRFGGPAATASIRLFGALDENLALARVIRRAHDTLFFHPLNDGGGAVIADREPPLDVAGGRLAVAQHDLHGLAIEVGAVVVGAEVA